MMTNNTNIFERLTARVSALAKLNDELLCELLSVGPVLEPVPDVSSSLDDKLTPPAFDPDWDDLSSEAA